MSKKIQLTESQLVSVIKKLIKEREVEPIAELIFPNRKVYSRAFDLLQDEGIGYASFGGTKIGFANKDEFDKAREKLNSAGINYDTDYNKGD